MNSRILNKVIQQSLRHSHCRYISIQQSINKCSSSCQTTNFHRKNENCSSSSIFTKFSSDRTFSQPSQPIYTNFQRNFSVATRLSQATSQAAIAEQVDAASNVVSPIVEDTRDLTLNWVTPDVSESIFVDHVQQMLFQVHQATGLPWWSTIALTAIIFRSTISLPFAITQVRLYAKLEKVNLSIVKIEKALKKQMVKAQKEYGWPEKLAKEKFIEVKDNAWWDLVKKENCHPVKTYYPVAFQTALWITATVGTISMCRSNIVGPEISQQMSTEGFGWVTDLTVVDPYFILPISIALVNLLNVEFHHSFRVIRRTEEAQWKFFFYRTLSVGIIPLAASMPAAANVYWLTSSLYGCLQTLFLNSRSMRRLFRVPTNTPELERPYRYFADNMKEKLRLGKGSTALVAK